MKTIAELKLQAAQLQIDIDERNLQVDEDSAEAELLSEASEYATQITNCLEAV